MPRKKAGSGGKESVKFEEALDRLEKIVEQLEEGEMELDRSLALFEEGVGLSRLCMKKLDEAQRKVEMLLQDPNGGVRSVPFEEGGEDGESP
jgi:exodeoxyribonuclease VII small subunit